MRHATFFAILVAVSGSAFAQNQPQLTWQGEVSGGANLFIQGNRVDVQGRTTGAVDRPTYRFRSSLPTIDQTVTVGVRQGRGSVRVVEQPTASNQYAAVVDIQNNGRPQMYHLEFFWDEGTNTSSRSGRMRNDRDAYRGRNTGAMGRRGDRGEPGRVTWSGQVDGEALVVLSGRRAFTTAVRGREVVGERADFEGVLPRQDANVVLSDIQGRGRIELLEQPSSSNNFAAKVRILDTAAGAGSYSFSLTWDGDGFQPGATSGGGAYDRNGGYDRGGILTPSGSGAGYGSNGSGGGNSFRWSGRVDGRVRVFAQGGRVWSQTVSGTPVSQERASVGSAMPRASLDADIRKLAGRDDVRLLERPTAGNNYTLVFEIDDEDGGADLYEVEVTWR